LVKTIPTKNKNYKIKDNANFSYSGLETEASIAMLTNNFEDYYGSVLPNKGKISVKVKNGVVTITVKNAQVCNSENTVCKTVSGQIVLE
jgi:tRNA A37 threonylcarbamoyltransferase TsaD